MYCALYEQVGRLAKSGKISIIEYTRNDLKIKLKGFIIPLKVYDNEAYIDSPLREQDILVYTALHKVLIGMLDKLEAENRVTTIEKQLRLQLAV